MRIAYAGGAYASFQDTVDRLRNYTVRVTPGEGEPFDAIVLGPDRASEWVDAVIVAEDDDKDGIPTPGSVRSVRVAELYVY